MSKTQRHIVTAAVTAVVVVVMVPLRSDWSPEMHRWNKAAADVGLLLIIAALAIGPAARLSKGLERLIPWARPLGIWGTVWTVAHIVILLFGWSEDGVLVSLRELFGLKGVPFTGTTVFTGSAIATANIVGTAALFYCLVMCATSNDASVRIFGTEGWRSLHRVYGHALFVLAAIHTAFFLYLFYGVFPRSAPPPNFFTYVFPPAVAVFIALRSLDFKRSLK